MSLAENTAVPILSIRAMETFKRHRFLRWGKVCPIKQRVVHDNGSLNGVEIVNYDPNATIHCPDSVEASRDRITKGSGTSAWFLGEISNGEMTPRHNVPDLEG